LKKTALFVLFLALLACSQDTDTKSLVDDLSYRLERAETANNKLATDLKIQKEMLNIITCESDGQHDGLYGDNGKAYGVAQWHKRTFDELKAKAFMPGLNYRSKHDQIKLLEWALRNGYDIRWSCSTKYKNKMKRGKQ
jgi:hypothetical protein